MIMWLLLELRCHNIVMVVLNVAKNRLPCPCPVPAFSGNENGIEITDCTLKHPKSKEVGILVPPVLQSLRSKSTHQNNNARSWDFVTGYWERKREMQFI